MNNKYIVPGINKYNNMDEYNTERLINNEYEVHETKNLFDNILSDNTLFKKTGIVKQKNQIQKSQIQRGGGLNDNIIENGIIIIKHNGTYL
jgi:hypothetical protein